MGVASMPLKDDILGPLILFGVLFFPVGVGILLIPLALFFGGPISWALLAVVALDYCVPLRRTPWNYYANMWLTPLASAYSSYFSAFAMRIHPEFKICQGRRYLFCAHPHGVFGIFLCVVHQHLSSKGLYMTMFAAPVLLALPLARRHLSWLGVTSADAPTMRKSLGGESQQVFWSTPGGIEEAFCIPNPNEQIVVEKRKGFCKIALQCGTDLVPVYGFGNNQVLPVLSGQGSILATLSKRLNVTLMAWYGRFYVPYSCIPMKCPQLVAVGKPIPVEKCQDPTQEQIEALHSKYSAAIRALFDQHKTDPILEKTGFAKRQLLFENEKQPE